ncbi:MAG: hypothetical protein ACOX7X_07865 [Methanosarcina flavescens]|jgi:hypothetical protein|uniref:Uncharacterized protein n=1 Tax=Methanosarcina flavescens TaxID=1715806 RepID=A0A660HNZ9_9EURY|nr:hypothetical protein [Methanosarcina flavescens]AYK13984.1 hypothetical protein AOB57_001060 [Methanosarcina flavescens]
MREVSLPNSANFPQAFSKNCLTASLLKEGLSANFLEKSLIKNRRDGVVKRRNGLLRKKRKVKTEPDVRSARVRI